MKVPRSQAERSRDVVLGDLIPLGVDFSVNQLSTNPPFSVSKASLMLRFQYSYFICLGSAEMCICVCTCVCPRKNSTRASEKFYHLMS